MRYHVTPSLAVDPVSLGGVQDVVGAVDTILAGKKTTVGSWEDAYVVLRHLDLDPSETLRRLAFAATGDLYGTPPTVS